MEIFLNIVFLLIGFALLIKGADMFVSGSSAIAKMLKISSIVIGLTIVSFGTSAPEAATSVAAAIKGSAGIATGNVVGSNLFNTLVVLAVSAIIIPVVVNKEVIKRDFPFLIGASLILLAFISDSYLGNGVNIISRGEALCFLVLIIGYVYLLVKSSVGMNEDSHIKIEEQDEKEIENEEKMPVFKIILFLVLGIAGIVFGGECVTKTATFIAGKLGMSDVLIGLTIVALGTSLPELVTSIIAAKRGENDIALGNVIGSNIFNIVFILGLAGTVSPLAVSSEVIIDCIIMIGVMILTFVFAITGKKVSRKEGIILLVIYFVYLAYIIARNYMS